jgi:hypothetical protein
MLFQQITPALLTAVAFPSKPVTPDQRTHLRPRPAATAWEQADDHAAAWAAGTADCSHELMAGGLDLRHRLSLIERAAHGPIFRPPALAS